MSYFNRFPKVLYNPNGDSSKLMTNIMKRVRVRANMVKEFALLDPYDIQDGETPEILADRHHGSPYYHWVIMLMNNIRDRFYEWPLSEQQFEEYVNAKYTNPGAVHHYEIAQSSGPTTSLDNSHLVEVNSDTTGATAVSNYEYERRRQDNLSLIKVLKPNFLSPFVEEFAKLMR